MNEACVNVTEMVERANMVGAVAWLTIRKVIECIIAVFASKKYIGLHGGVRLFGWFFEEGMELIDFLDKLYIYDSMRTILD